MLDHIDHKCNICDYCIVSDTEILLFCVICKRLQGSMTIDIKELFGVVEEKKIYPKLEEAKYSEDFAKSLT